ncbi:hypothetical protein KC480_05620 [Bacillus velezensis]|uniref:hypothetical protein n=1 Tax=Bacillus velezensis TaxID=492670 RepID=UPI001E412551|nr:hypothetical protein [Bacillus velezensis]MCD7911002.1 hypothetical protein [Bacillus velezensis]
MGNVKLTELVDFLNKWSEDKGHIIRFEGAESISSTVNILIVDEYIDSSAFNLKDKFYEDLERILKKEFNLQDITYNNTKTCFWKHFDIVSDNEKRRIKNAYMEK